MATHFEKLSTWKKKCSKCVELGKTSTHLETNFRNMFNLGLN